MALLIFILILSILILVHEFGHFIVAKRIGVRVEIFSWGFGKKLLSFKKGDTVYALSAIPLGGYVKFAGDERANFSGKPDEYLSRKPSERAGIIFCGPLLNYMLALICFVCVFYLGAPVLTTKVGALVAGFPAQKAGVKVGDKILEIDGKKTPYWEDMQLIIQEKKGEPANLLVMRGDSQVALVVQTKAERVGDATGKKQTIGVIGIRPAGEIVIIPHGFIESIGLGFHRLFMLTQFSYRAIWHIITGSLSLRDSITGPLGIFYVTSNAAKAGFVALVYLVGVLNVSLGVFNLLPFPILDGGHLAFLALEKVRGKPLSLKIEEGIHNAGLTFIIIFATFVFYNDLVKFGVIQKLSRFFVGL